jgi:hypothetical protein
MDDNRIAFNRYGNDHNYAVIMVCFWKGKKFDADPADATLWNTLYF